MSAQSPGATRSIVDNTDWLKVAAIVLVPVDHFGYFFMEDELWWSAFDRLAAPIFFFLLGLCAGPDRSAPLDLVRCRPVAERWVVIFWSPNVLALSEETRAILLMGATFTAIRLQKLIPPHAGGVGIGHVLTARELSVLRLLSNGHSMRDAPALLELGEETIRSHLKKAEAKLGVHGRSHAIAQALRLHLIP